MSEFDDAIEGIFKTFDFTHALDPITVEVPSATADDVLRDIDQLRRDLSGYHGQLKAHNDLQRHCDNQRKRIKELEGLYARAKAENAELRELLRDTLIQTDQYCDKYGIEYEDIADALYKANADLNRRLHELGVEVNE